MKTKRVKKLTPIERFLYWVQERYKIYLKKEADEPPPWTDDEILQTVFFTNPYRELDKTTQWFRKHVRDPLKNDNRVLMATVIFRWFNLPCTGVELLDYGEPNRRNLLVDWNLKAAVRRLKTLSNLQQVFTGAFNISNSGSTKPKINRVCEDYIQPMWKDRRKILGRIKGDSLEQAHKVLMQYKGMGGSGFMAYEVVCDLRYTKLLTGAKDINTWSNPGPGAKRGLNRILGRDVKHPVNKEEWQYHSEQLLHQLKTKLCLMPEFEMREVEHSLCEWDKMERVLWGEGKIKRKYNGRA